MEKQQAKQLIRRVFESDFDLDTYKQFLSELLVNIETGKTIEFVYNQTYIHEKFRKHISSYRRIGKYQSEDKTIDLLLVKLNENCNLDRNRSGLRNFVMHYLNGGRGGKIRDAALVAFIEPNTSRWRLSLICLEIDPKVTEKGNLTTTEKATSAKRYSFILGDNEPSHTAQQQFLPYLESNKHKPTLAQLEMIFSVEKLSDEFFDDYVELLTKTKTGIVAAARVSHFYLVHEEITEEKNEVVIKYFLIKDAAKIDVGNFAKKLLGQIVFLYFLQKKGWLGVPKDKDWGIGDKTFMRHVFKEKVLNSNYFNQFLEPLFYEALASERDQDYFTLLDCKIPFLNGGLFEPYPGYDWINHKLELSNSLFSNDETISATKNSIELIGTGILDVFDRYNFTVCEDEPLDKEVAIDPEMLGKIFENTIEENERKGKGAFYTPRPVVHYMVKQSLIKYMASHLDYINDIKNKDDDDNNLLVNNPENHAIYADLEQLVNNAEFYLEHEAQIANKGESKNYRREVPESIAVNATRIDKLLADITILDPAVGSGAFPVGLLIELVKLRQLLQEYSKDKKSVYELKYHAIANSIYGVDIDAGAIDVARLRLWLSLIVDEHDFSNASSMV